LVDADVVRVRLARLDQQLQFLQPVAELPLAEFLADHRTHAAAERDLQVAVECVLDICNHIVATEGLGAPASYRDAIVLLGRGGVIPADFAKRLAPMASFRNILVHGYLELDRTQVHRFLCERLEDLRTFGMLVLDWIDRAPTPTG